MEVRIGQTGLCTRAAAHVGKWREAAKASEVTEAAISETKLPFQGLKCSLLTGWTLVKYMAWYSALFARDTEQISYIHTYKCMLPTILMVLLLKLLHKMNFITAFHWRHDMSKLSIMTLQDDETWCHTWFLSWDFSASKEGQTWLTI